MNGGRLWLAVGGLLMFTACGAGVSTAYRGTAPATASDPSLVQVIDGSPTGELRVVSLSTWSVHVTDALPTAPPASAVEAMRSDAAARGATRLHLERVDSPFRKAFYGVGVVSMAGASASPEPCDHNGFNDGLSRARRAAERCVDALRVDRPALQGEITVVFQVDAGGEVMRAAATPASTRDGMAQHCAVQAVHRADFGPPTELTCAGALDVSFGDEVSR